MSVMRARRGFAVRVGDVLAFVFTVVIGVAMGGAMMLGDAVEEQFTSGKPGSEKQIDDRR